MPGLTRSKDDSPDGEQRKEKRRAINRKAQQRAREQKQSLIQRLILENQQLKTRLLGNSLGDSILQARQSVSNGHGSSTSPQFLTSSSASQTTHNVIPSPASAGEPPPPAVQPLPAMAFVDLNVSSLDLNAARQAFLAVLASVCDPHLNTIHAVCQKFAQSRGADVAAGDLHPPRPVNRPLNTAPLHDPLNLFEQLLAAAFDNVTDPAEYIPPAGQAGPLAVPFLEPMHPVDAYELDGQGVWSLVVDIVDLSRTDLEDLAGRLTRVIRCYGFGPVMLRNEVTNVCRRE
ncbi:uncharacterized protein EHS24_005555 [Apiotrichum porosum]|uniref:BZIP domain-containing protein n=1 Tax=Apiotrichum porosum TaxID=105984 RepID=A0A427XCJ8_9TREE|nr:uncharacterized protein EHS24_005555 [Apiotrichum porosum]RSH76566.1 hypothetical protein EHS24_005555 [Apiotrichum porosum]